MLSIDKKQKYKYILYIPAYSVYSIYLHNICVRKFFQFSWSLHHSLCYGYLDHSFKNEMFRYITLQSDKWNISYKNVLAVIIFSCKCESLLKLKMRNYYKSYHLRSIKSEKIRQYSANNLSGNTKEIFNEQNVDLKFPF